MGTSSGHFFEKPRSSLGWWSVALGAVFVTLFILVTNDFIHFSGILTIALGVLAGLTTLGALIWKRERSWLVWLTLIPGLFAILFALGEILVPH